MRKRIMIAGVATLALVGAAGGVAFATGVIADDEKVTGPQADRAVDAALASTGGGIANSVERDGEDGAFWEVEVTRPDGATVDVRLDENLDVVVIEGDHEEPDADDLAENDGDVEDDGDEGDHITGPQADRIAAAALDATGGGTALSVDLDGEDGATWEVEVRKPDGSTVDVRLDDNLRVVAIGAEEEAGDTDD
jgi:uncharacterized membrane protein YkoI